jgi:cell division protein FtsI/penicillin-binding protein 2
LKIVNDNSAGITILFFAFLIAAFLLLAVRCFYLQLLKGGHYTALCTRQQQSYHLQKPQRGVILDCRGRVLAASNRTQTIFAEPRIIKRPQITSEQLAPIVDISAGQIDTLIRESENPGYVKIKAGADSNQCDAASKIYGIGVESSWQRHYPMGSLASQVLGFSGIDNTGLCGIELQYDKELKGSAGQNIFLADVYRRPIRLKHSDICTDGVGLILTIDAAVQQFVRAELLKQYEEFAAESAVAIVAEPHTGAILAMVSLPDFAPAALGRTDPNNLRNRAIADQFEPGSILKPVVAAIALDTGVLGQNEKIFCEYGHYSGKGFGHIGEYGGHEYGDLTVREILAVSSNIGMAKIGQRIDKDQLHKGLSLFGFGRQTGIDLPGEAEGLLSPADSWTGYSRTRIPFGQEISVTAIQLIRAFCVLANGGRPVQPFLVSAMVDNEGRIIKLKRPPLAVGFVIKPQIARWIVTEALVGVVNEGTGKKASLAKWQVFGKTGTAQLALSDQRGYSDRDYIASFIAGAPAEAPAVLVLVSIYKPDISLGKGYTGGTVAAPVAAKILEKTLNYLEKH